MNNIVKSATLLSAMSIFLITSCNESPEKPFESAVKNMPLKPDPRSYVCYRTNSPVTIDGVLTEKEWGLVPWTEDFGDIEGARKPAPKYKTHVKMLWDDTNLYIAAELEEPHVWAKLRQRDTVIFMDNDFEIFIDPDGDTHAYYEIEVNAFATEWDLLLLKPYRDGGNALNGWDISGLKTGVKVNGTINNPSDEDKGWTVEFSIPLSELKDWRPGKANPAAGDHWRINFSRVEWRTLIENGTYKKEINPATGRSFPEDNWVWSPQDRINMHMPEMWGYLQFSAREAGSGKDEFVRDAGQDEKWALRMIYYAENEFFTKNKRYSGDLHEIGLNAEDFPEGVSIPTIQTTRTTFESFSDGGRGWTIYNDSRLINIKDTIK